MVNGWELAKYCEIDKYASRSYSAIHGVSEEKNMWDITKVDVKEIPDCTLICGGSPCQDFSIAGKMAGMDWVCEECGTKYNPISIDYRERNTSPRCQKCGSQKIQKTRSSLLVEYLRIVEAKRPKLILYENVKNILSTGVSHNFRETFDKFVHELESYGYVVKWAILNAKDYGVPQNRARLYLVGVQKEYYKDWEFPKSCAEKVTLQEVIEETVESKYYLKQTLLEKFVEADDFNTVLNALKGNTVCAVDKTNAKHHVREIANCITTREDRGLSKRSAEGTAIVYGKEIHSTDGVTIPTVKIDTTAISVRKLTPKECFRLFGFTDEDYEKVRAVGMSDAQMYKQTGNSIVVDVVYEILCTLRQAMPELFADMKVVSLFSGIGAFEKALTKLYSTEVVKEDVQSKKAQMTLIVDDIYNNRKKRIYTVAAPTIRSARSGLKVCTLTEV